MKNSALLPTAKSITRQQVVAHYLPMAELDRAIEAGKVKPHPQKRIVWFRLSEILEYNESLTK